MRETQKKDFEFLRQKEGRRLSLDGVVQSTCDAMVFSFVAAGGFSVLFVV